MVMSFERVASLAAGLLFSTAAGYWALHYLLGAARGAATGPARSSGTFPLADSVGLMERALYTGAWQLKTAGFIPLWVLLRVAAHWKALSGESREGKGAEMGGLFLLETGVSLAFGAGGGLISDALARNAWPAALTLALVLAGGTLGLGWFLSRGRP